MKHAKLKFAIWGIMLLLIVFAWPYISSRLALWIATPEKQCTTYLYISNSLETIFLGLTFLASSFAFFQAYGQLTLMQKQQRIDSVLKSLENLPSREMTKDVINFIDNLCKWHVENKMWMSSQDMESCQKDEYVELTKQWECLFSKNIINCAHCITILTCVKQIELEYPYMNLVEATVAQKIGKQAKVVISAICYRSIIRSDTYKQALAKSGKKDVNILLKQYISEQIQSDNSNIEKKNEKILIDNILKFFRGGYLASSD